MTQDSIFPSEPPSEEDVREFESKYSAFFETLPENEKLQAASLMVLGVEGKPADGEQIDDENREVAPVSEEEIDAFVAKLDSFHDGLPEGQHQILDAIVGHAFHESDEDAEEDVQGHRYLWYRNVWANDWNTLDYYSSYCHRQGGSLFFQYWAYDRYGRKYQNVGCWVPW